MKKFVIFTDNTETCFNKGSNPFTIMKCDKFGEFKVVLIDESGGKVIINSKKITDKKPSNWKVLIHKDDAKLNTVVLKKCIQKEDKVFVLLHKGVDTPKDKHRKVVQKKKLKSIYDFNDDDFIEQSHDESSIFWNELIEIARHASAGEDYQGVLNNLELYWKIPELEEEVEKYVDLYLSTMKGDKSPDQDQLDRIKAVEKKIEKLCQCK